MTTYADGPRTQVSLLIDAPASTVWELVSDPALPGRISSELDAAEWLRHVDGSPGVGSVIGGRNSNDFMGEWTTESIVTDWDPGRRFSWAVRDVEDSAARWGFTLEASDRGTVLRQDYRIGPGSSGVSRFIEMAPDDEEAIIARRLRAQRRDMMGNLRAVKAMAETESASPAIEADDVRLVLVAGGGGSGDAHWHHVWAAEDPRCEWVEQADWAGGTRGDWVDALDRQLRRSSAPVVLVAHSLGCVVAAHWAADRDGPVIGALLVAPADIEDDWVEPGSIHEEFVPIPVDPLPFPSIVVNSTDDPLLSVERAAALADRWHAGRREVGAHLHLGSHADLGGWPEGREILERLLP